MLKFLSGSVTQSAADTYTSTSVATGLANASLGYKVRGFLFGWPNPVEVDSYVSLQLLRRAPTASVDITDRTLLWKETKYIKLTTSGLIVYPEITWTPIDDDLELIIVEDPIYFAVGSGTTGLANAGRFRIYYEEVRLSETAKLAALTESLNA